MQTPTKATPPIAAATMILVRQYQDDLQVYLLKRHPRSGFMANNFVFPGGVVDFYDGWATAWQTHVDLDPNEIDSRLGGDLSGRGILPYGVAAIRETFEEAGVLLIDRLDVYTEVIERIGAMRLAGGLPEGWFLSQTHGEGWTLTLSALSRWSRWITPERMSRRYDTRFFLTVMPSGQVCRPDSHEVTDGIWINPANGLAANLAGRIPLSPPTLVVLTELMAYTSLDHLLVSSRYRSWGRTVMPRLIRSNNEAVIIEPWDPDYGDEEISIDFRGLGKEILPVGAPFSRLWYSEGVWRPIPT